MAEAAYNLHLKTQAQQLNVLHKAIPTNMLVIVVSAVIYAVVLWEVVNQQALQFWFALSLAIAFARLILFYWKWRFLDDENTNSFKQFVFVGNVASGLLWGVSTSWFFPEQLEYQLFMLFMLGGLALGTSFTNVNYLPGYYAYIWASLPQVAFALIMVSEKNQQGIGVTTILFIIAISFYGRALGKTIYESIRLRFENDDLIQELEEKSLIAEEANTSKSKFLATASHDLRQPLHTSSLLLDALKFTLEKDTQKDILDKVQSSQGRLSTLFDSLLDISNLDSGSVNVDFETVSVAQLYSALSEEYALAAENKGLKFSVESSDHWIKTDPVLIARIIGNLLSNAIRYTPKGHVSLSVSEDDNKQILLSVTDTGIGISNNQHEKIFHEFEQLNNSHRDYRLGLGLGLSIVKRLSSLLDHEVHLTSEQGIGSTFTIACQKSQKPEQTPTTRHLPEDIYIERTLNLLFVDDERPAREAISLVLENFNVKVVTAESASQAIAKLDDFAKPPDVIIADFRLKDGETGIDVIDRVREYTNIDIPAIIISGEVDLDSIARSQQRDFIIVQKPVSTAVLMPLMLNSVKKNHRHIEQ